MKPIVKARQFSLRWLMLIVISIAIVSAIARSVAIAHFRSAARSEALFAMEMTHVMLLTHMSRNNGKWPENWNDLQSEFPLVNRGYRVPNFAWVSDRVNLEFGFDPIDFASHHDQKGASSLNVLKSDFVAPASAQSIKIHDGLKTFILNCAEGWKIRNK